MNKLIEQHISCPYCGESIGVLIDPQEAGSEYIEDCQVCCRPITFKVWEDETGEVSISFHDENESY